MHWQQYFGVHVLLACLQLCKFGVTQNNICQIGNWPEPFWTSGAKFRPYALHLSKMSPGATPFPTWDHSIENIGNFRKFVLTWELVRNGWCNSNETQQCLHWEEYMMTSSVCFFCSHGQIRRRKPLLKSTTSPRHLDEVRRDVLKSSA